jgi:hypothetical protein
MTALIRVGKYLPLVREDEGLNALATAAQFKLFAGTVWKIIPAANLLTQKTSCHELSREPPLVRHLPQEGKVSRGTTYNDVTPFHNHGEGV